jgi:hypothetical protein
MPFLNPWLRYPFDDEGIKPDVKENGFGKFEVPEMPRYVQSFSGRGNYYDAQTTPVYQQARFGNPKYKGGMDAYVSQVEDLTFFESLKQKKGNHGVFEQLRWNTGHDWRGNFGVASLDASKNYTMSTRGGQLRKGGPKRSDYMDRPNAWFDKTMPGISHSRYTQNGNNYAGVWEYKKNTPFIELDNDMLVLRDMIEHNPFHISSHAAAQAKEVYDAEFGKDEDKAFQGYRSDITPAINHARYPELVQDTSPLVDQQQYNNIKPSVKWWDS